MTSGRAQPPGGADSDRAPRLLLVEDDEILLYSLRKHLCASGFDVLPLHDPFKAIDAVESDVFDIILTDIVFGPNAPHGVSLAQMARRRHPNLPVLFLTAFPEVASAAESTGRVFVKPVDMNHLVRAIWETLEGSRSSGDSG